MFGGKEDWSLSTDLLFFSVSLEGGGVEMQVWNGFLRAEVSSNSSGKDKTNNHSKLRYVDRG